VVERVGPIHEADREPPLPKIGGGGLGGSI
jgi:hypothetical protein